jgi:hypothetical protein
MKAVQVTILLVAFGAKQSFLTVIHPRGAIPRIKNRLCQRHSPDIVDIANGSDAANEELKSFILSIPRLARQVGYNDPR